MSNVLAKAFWDRVDRGPEHECWLWKGTLGKRNYGQPTLQRRVPQGVEAEAPSLGSTKGDK
jgi:hypothetical protein